MAGAAPDEAAAGAVEDKRTKDASAIEEEAEEAEMDELDGEGAPPPSAEPAKKRPMAPSEAAGGAVGGGPGGPIGDADGGLDIRVPAINGGLHRDIIRRTAGTHEADIRGCVPPALAANPGLADVLTLALEYEGDGKVSKATIPEDSPFTLDAVEDCVRELAEGWSFDAPDEGEGGELTLEIRLQ